MKFEKIELSRLIIHKIIAKKGTAEAYSLPSNSLHVLDAITKETLLERISKAVGKSKRFFETQLDKVEDGTYWSYAKNLKNLSESDFITNTTYITEIAVEAHQHNRRPGGLLIIIDALVDDFPASIVIKAELQEALTLKGNSVELIKELFLSPAMDFYKIGVLIQSKADYNKKDSFKSFVYDDNFNPKRHDLAAYFYKEFLGFSTSENDKLKTSKFYSVFEDFVNTNVDDHQSRKNIKIKLKSDYRESSSKIIDPTTYSEFFDHDIEIHKKFEEKILKKFPRSFVKDLTLVDSSLQNASLLITNQLRIFGPSDLVDNVEVLNPNDEISRNRLITEIDSGEILKVVALKTNSIRQSFERDS